MEISNLMEKTGGNKNRDISNAEVIRWFAPLLQALRDLGGEATPAQARMKIIENEHLTEEEVMETRGKNKSNKFSNDVDFVRMYLVDSGYIDGTQRGVWKLTESGKTVKMTDELATKIYRTTNNKQKK